MLLKKTPLPFCGVALGLAALGNLLSTYPNGATIKNICGALSALILIWLLVKFIINFKAFVEEIKNPIMGSIIGTYCMALMILGGYKWPNAEVGKTIWFIGLILHVILIIYFTKEFVFKFGIKKVFTSWYIVYVGIVAMNINCADFGMQELGKIVFWFGFASTLVLLVLVTYRYLIIKDFMPPAIPLFCIYTAPVSLCLAGYMNTFTPPEPSLIYFMLILSLLIYLIVLVNLPRFLMMPFYPSYAAFTFPFVISAVAVKLTTAKFLTSNNPVLANTTKMIFTVQTWIAAVLVAYALARYIMFIIATEEASK
jgi:exfoliative toxin A/B